MSLENQFREAMAQFAGTVTAVTTMDGETPMGFIATAVCSLSVSPASLIVCVNKDVSAHGVILRDRKFGVNVLHPSQSAVVGTFCSNKGAARFVGEGWNLNGEVPLLDDAVAAIQCRVEQVYDGYTHSILVGVVEEVRLRPSDEEGCLIWKQQKLHKPVCMAA